MDYEFSWYIWWFCKNLFFPAIFVLRMSITDLATTKISQISEIRNFSINKSKSLQYVKKILFAKISIHVRKFWPSDRWWTLENNHGKLWLKGAIILHNTDLATLTDSFHRSHVSPCLRCFIRFLHVSPCVTVPSWKYLTSWKSILQMTKTWTGRSKNDWNVKRLNSPSKNNKGL